MKTYYSKENALEDARATGQRAWVDRNHGIFAVGDWSELPGKINAGSSLHCDWALILDPINEPDVNNESPECECGEPTCNGSCWAAIGCMD